MRSSSAVFQIAGWLAVILILILSLVPGYARPHVLASGKLEHFAAYFLTAVVLALGYRGWSRAIGIALLLSAYSGILEILQL
jgi:hypothetical protein